MKNDKTSYQLIRGKSRSDHQAALVKLCEQGGIGESLVREGFTKRGWNSFILALVKERQAAGKDDPTILNALSVVDAGNASASRQALQPVAIRWEMLDDAGESILATKDEPAHLAKKGEPMWTAEQSLEAYWTSIGEKGGKADLSCLE